MEASALAEQLKRVRAAADRAVKGRVRPMPACTPPCPHESIADPPKNHDHTHHPHLAQAESLRDAAVTAPLGEGLAHCLARPQDEEVCHLACNLVPTLARALTQHGSALALRLLPHLLDRLQDGQVSAWWIDFGLVR